MKPTHELIKDIRFSAAILLALYIAAYWIPLTTIVNTWMKNDDYSYGFLVPFISAYLLWDMRGRFTGVQIKSSWAVFPILVFFVLLSIYGILGSSGNISMPSMPLLIICFTAFYFGINITLKAILPLGFLIFMVPIPSVIERTIGVFLKSISSKLGGEIIKLFNISVNVSGNIIDLGVTQLQVVDACSGLRYLFPLFALGIIYAYFFERATWKRIFCVLATIPIAIMTNALRIGVTGILTDQYGPSVAQGFFHGFSGWVLFMVAFFFLFLIGCILAKLPPKLDKRKKSPLPRPDSNFQNLMEGPGINASFITSVILLVIVSGLSLSTKALPAMNLKGGIKSFPLAFSDWTGQASFVDQEMIDKSGAEDAFNGSYRNIKGDAISLYIGYRATAFLANENFFHSPTVCLPSSGWETLSTSTRVITNVPFWGQLKVTRMIVSNLGDRLLVYFWFQTKNKSSYDKNINRLDLALHAIRRDNTYDLFIRMITQIHPNEPIEASEQRMDAFVRDMTIAMQRYIRENQIINSVNVK